MFIEHPSGTLRLMRTQILGFSTLPPYLLATGCRMSVSHSSSGGNFYCVLFRTLMLLS